MVDCELTDEYLIGQALIAAQKSGPNDVPVGAVVFDFQGNLLGQAGNAREQLGDPTAHAEILAMRQAARCYGDNWRLTGTILAVTLEPCTMCAGALVAARISKLVFGAFEPKTGAVGSLWDVVRDRRLHQRIQVRGGIRAQECSSLLQNFFAHHRFG